MPFQLAVVDQKNNAIQKPQVDYLPFGVKTVKLMVSGTHKGKIRLHPARFSSRKDEGEKFGHEDEGSPPQFIVAWGGGHEDYYELDFPAKRFVHFLVWHIGETVVDSDLTIVARDPRGEQETSLTIHLMTPREGNEIWGKDDVNRPFWEEKKRGLYGITDVYLKGDYTPNYQSRWWPPNRVFYDYKKETPAIRLAFERLVDRKKSRIQIFATLPNGAEKHLATMRGNISYPLYDMCQMVPELYRFGPQTWVLRIWLFWLDLNPYGENRKQPNGLNIEEFKEASRGIKARERGGAAQREWGELHEIPDAERVDILFDDGLNVLYAATDLHWRELWGQFAPKNARDPLLARITNTYGKALLHPEEWSVFKGWRAFLPNPLKKNEPYRPVLEVRSELKGEGTLAPGRVGLTETHTPAFLNILMEARFTSTDVRNG